VSAIIGKVTRVLGPVVHAASTARAQMLEFVEVGLDRLIGEIVRLQGNQMIIRFMKTRPG
jgi:vacuolar-type H+-ATPase catalytic subunit A/Vma1